MRKIVKKHDPTTPKQLASRAKFALVNKKMSPLNNAIKKGFRGDAKVYRKAVTNAYHEAIAGEYSDYIFQYSKVKIADGKLEVPRKFSALADEDFCRVKFTWDPRRIDSSLTGKANDKVNIVCFNEDFLMILRHSAAKGELMVKL